MTPNRPRGTNKPKAPIRPNLQSPSQNFPMPIPRPK